MILLFVSPNDGSGNGGDGSSGSGCSVLVFLLLDGVGSVTFLACCAVSHVVFGFGLSLRV